MTTPPPEPPPHQPDEGSEEPSAAQPKRLVARGFWTAVLVSVVGLALALAGLPLGAAGIIGPLLLLAVVVYLVRQARQHPDTGYGGGAALGCATVFLVAGGVCIAILSTIEF